MIEMIDGPKAWSRYAAKLFVNKQKVQDSLKFFGKIGFGCLMENNFILWCMCPIKW